MLDTSIFSFSHYVFKSLLVIGSLKLSKLCDKSLISYPFVCFARILNNNDFRFLHENPFTNLSSLVTLNLQENSIQYLPSTALHGCSSLANL